MQHMGRMGRAGAVLMLLAPWMVTGRAEGTGGAHEFERVATFVVCSNTSCDTDVVESTVAEIVTASADGRTLAYADSVLRAVGFVDIANPEQPQARGVVPLDGSPSSVAVVG